MVTIDSFQTKLAWRLICQFSLALQFVLQTLSTFQFVWIPKFEIRTSQLGAFADGVLIGRKTADQAKF